MVTKRRDPKRELRTYKEEAAVAAVQLGYSRQIVNRIRNATSEGEVVRALAKGRESISDACLKEQIKMRINQDGKKNSKH